MERVCTKISSKRATERRGSNRLTGRGVCQEIEISINPQVMNNLKNVFLAWLIFTLRNPITFILLGLIVIELLKLLFTEILLK